MNHYLYEVVGRREYRGHPTGTRFEARHDAALQRAINRGDIKVLAEVDVSLQEGSYTLPPDWPPLVADTAANQGAERRPSHR